MNDLLQTVDELRRMSAAELAQVGEDSLTARLKEQAEAARLKHGALRAANMENFLSDPVCVRYPTRLVLEYGEMGLHQFAQPDLDYRNRERSGRILYLRPPLGKRPDLLALAVSYMIPVLNYGPVITDEHCLAYGAVLQGLDVEAYYRRICEVADYAGAEVCLAGANNPSAQTPSAGAGCGCGGGGCQA